MIDLKKFRTDNNIPQSEVCDLLNVRQPYISNIENGKRPLNEEKFKILYNHYGDILLKYKITERPIVVSEEHEIYDSKPHISYFKGVPYYNVDFIGGFDLVLNDQTIKPEYLIDFKQYNDATCWCNVTGHSMEPEISNGDIIALKELHEWRTFIPSGEVCAIVTTEHRTIKKVTPSNREGYLILTPNNKSPEYVPQEIPISIIKKVYKVLGCMKKI